MDKNNILDTVELTEEQAQAFVEKLNEWKRNVERNSSIRLKFFEEEVKQKLEEKYGALFEEAKEKLQAVYSSRLEESIREMYNAIKNKVIKEWVESPEYKAFRSAKELFAPFLVEKGIKETVELKEAEAEKWRRKAEKIEAQAKLESLLENLPEDVAVKLKQIIGEVNTVDEAVESFNKAIKIMGLTKKALEAEGFVKIDENIDPNPDPTERPLPSGDSKYEEKKKNKKKKVNESEEEPEESDEYDSEDEEDVEYEEPGIEDDEEKEEYGDDEDEEDEEDTYDDEEDEEDEEDGEEDDDDDEEEDDEEDGFKRGKKAIKKKNGKKSKADKIAESLFNGDFEGDVITEGDQSPVKVYDKDTLLKMRIKQLAGDI